MYDKSAIKGEFKKGDLVLVLATSKQNKLSAEWIGPGKVQNKTSDTNYIVSLPGRKQQSQIYHIYMLKPYYQKPELVNFLNSQEIGHDVDHGIEIPSISSDPNIFIYDDIIQQSELKNKLNIGQMDQFKTLLVTYSNLFSNNPGVTHLVEHDIELDSNEVIRAKPYRM